MKINAYAKINLGLYVVGKRPDGFHNIETIFHRINLFDEITVSPSPDISVECSNPNIPNNEENLCWKAVSLLRNELKVEKGASVHIQKNIPVGAGLGGGSSNAAAVLRYLPTLWNVAVKDDVLKRLALQLGSDVPFFLGDNSALGEGRGEILQETKLTLPYWIILVNPNIHISTPWAYQALSENRNGIFPERKSLKETFSRSPIQTILQSGNDFEEVVFDHHLKIKKIKLHLKELGATVALMSGSGSSVFGLYEDMISALKAVEFFHKEHFVHLTEPYFSIS